MRIRYMPHRLALAMVSVIITIHSLQLELADAAMWNKKNVDHRSSGLASADLEKSGRQLKLLQLSLPSYDVNYQGPSQAAALSLKSGGSTRYDRSAGTLGRNLGVSAAYAFAAEPPPAVRLARDGLRGFGSETEPKAIADTYLQFENDGSIRGGARAEAEGSLLSVTNAQTDIVEDEIHLEGNNQARSRATATASSSQRRSSSDSTRDNVQTTYSSVEAAVNALAREDLATADQNASADTGPSDTGDQCSQAEVLGEAIANGRLREDFVRRIRLDWRCDEGSSDMDIGAQGKELLQANNPEWADGNVLSSRLRPMGRRVTMLNR
ncbi:hypothetical protein BSKO_09923 [Bryopsis sp. KO-2023]|nr:hypothetical protein BSKO_09923 [Bryopsis sp. KO-2023]